MNIKDITGEELYALRWATSLYIPDGGNDQLKSLLGKLIDLMKQEHHNPTSVKGRIVAAEVKSYDPTVIDVTLRMTVPTVTMNNEVRVTL